jgi:beta-lactam-binding protein with PASTA domain
MLTLKGEARSVPRVVNLTLDEAIVQLENAGLQYRVDSQYDPNVPPFTVLQQDPRNMTRVKPGRTIALLVAKHRPPTVLLPRIVNVDVQQATYLLNSWGLRVGNLNYVAGNEPDIVKKAHFEGQLLEENAALLVGSRVDLTISRGQGKGKVKLPDVRGRSMMDAISILKQHGLDVQQPVRYTTRGSAPDGGRPTQGMVVLMDPAPGSVDSVRVGTVVELQVFGTGPEEVNEGTGDVTPPR